MEKIAIEKMTMQKKAPIYLIDGSSYIYRAFFAISQSLTTHDGFPTKAIFGVTNMLWKVLKEKDPVFVAVIWDAKGPTFRHKLYDKYKANRPPMPEDLSIQIPHIREIVAALGLEQMELEGYEADDLIATLAKNIKEDMPIIIVSGDKDLFQLVNEKVTIWDPMKDEYIDLDKLGERFGLTPNQLTDVMALSGDSTDNIPGCPGVGPKTATKLIKKYGSLEEVLYHIEEMPKSKLKESLYSEKERLPLWKSLVALKADAPVPLDMDTYRKHPPDQKRLRELFQKFEFARFLKELVPGKTINFEEYELIQDEEELKRWMEKIIQAKRFVIDTETTSQFPMQAKLVGLSLCVEPPSAAYVPIAHKTDEPQIPISKIKEILGPILKDSGIKKVGQNIKYDLLVLKNHGIELRGIEGDTMIASYLLNPSRHQHNLAQIAQEFLGHRMIAFKEVTANKKRVSDFSYVPLPLARDYSCEDAHVTAMVMEELWKRLREHGLWQLFENVECPLIQVLADMEETGILVDKYALKGLSKEFSERISQLEEKIYRLSGERFNINSPQQLAEILFVKHKLPQIKKTRKKTGYSTDVEVLTELSRHHELPSSILSYRNLMKLKSTYVDGLLSMINPKTGRIHTSFNQTVTATGRLSSSEPNLQNIPIRTEEGRRIRAAFVAEPGHVFVSADYSQIDLRVLAHYCQDKTLLSAFRKGEDIHTRTAAEVFGVEPEIITPEMRRIAKTVNFGIVYGMSAFGLSKELGIEKGQAKEFIERYFKRYPGVKSYMHEIVKVARGKGFITTILGRRRYLPEIKSSSRPAREFAERTAINTPIQGSAADLIKLAMLRIHDTLIKNNLKAKMLLQVHDELVLEVPKEEAMHVARLLKDEMEGAMELDLPLVAKVSSGPNWSDLTVLDI